MLCQCRDKGDQDKFPTLDNLPPEPADMTHADHYFRFASIVKKRYVFQHWDTERWLTDYGGFLTSVLKTNRSALLEVSAVDLRTTNHPYQRQGMYHLFMQVASTKVIDMNTVVGLGNMMVLEEIPSETEDYLRPHRPPRDMPGENCTYLCIFGLLQWLSTI